jgi:hypothetical protein
MSAQRAPIYDKMPTADKHFDSPEVASVYQVVPWPESASELYRPSNHRLSAKLMPTFADIECEVVSITAPYGRILGFLDWSRYFFSK